MFRKHCWEDWVTGDMLLEGTFSLWPLQVLLCSISFHYNITGPVRQRNSSDQEAKTLMSQTHLSLFSVAYIRYFATNRKFTNTIRLISHGPEQRSRLFSGRKHMED